MCREGKCQQRCDEGYGFLDGKPVLAQHLFEFGEFRLRVSSAWNRKSR